MHILLAQAAKNLRVKGRNQYLLRNFYGKGEREREKEDEKEVITNFMDTHP